MRPFLIAALLMGCNKTEPVDPPPTEDTEPTFSTTVGDTGDSFHDLIARPATPTLDGEDFSSASQCVACHPVHVQEWATSMHAYAMVDPVFQALVKMRQEYFDGKQDQFCISCHTPIGTRSGEVPDNFRFEDMSELAMEGVTCDGCHKITSIDRVFNGGHVIDGKVPMQGPIEDPAASAFHESAYSPLFGEPELCGSCHDVNEISGLNLERPYEEYTQSPLFGQTSCQDCHMPARENSQAAVDGPVRTTHNHRFVGVELPLLPDFLEEDQRQAAQADIDKLFEGVASLSLQMADSAVPGGQLNVFVTTVNHIAGHNLPTGTTFIRQVWVDLTVTDANGSVIFRTGDLDDNGDLRDAFSALDPWGDEDLINYTSAFLDANGEPDILSWRAKEHFSRTIPPLLDRTNTLFVPIPEGAVGPLTVDARLKFRTHAPYLLRAVGLPELIPQIQTRELSADIHTVELVTP